jgi:lipoprotein-anchoring transpeptidase ErfK/SrfK
MKDRNAMIEISIGQQKLSLLDNGRCIAEFAVSTAANGAGEKSGSECTPRGIHRIYEKIGGGCETGTVFVSREPTGEIYTEKLQKAFPDRDWILTRILRLAGEEDGVNKGDRVDTLERMIYIHGSPDHVAMGIPGSHGCVRMKNQDVIKLFDLVEVGTRVVIHD